MPDITLILHNIRSTHNVGSIFRTAEGLGVTKIILSGYTPYPKRYESPKPTKKHTTPEFVATRVRPLHEDGRLPHLAEKITNQIHKTALGAETMVPFEHIEKIDSKLQELRQNDVPLYALEQHPKSISLKDFVATDTFALILGEEVNGITPEILQQCDKIVEIPMCGKKESFNVSVAAGIALYALH